MSPALRPHFSYSGLRHGIRAALPGFPGFIMFALAFGLLLSIALMGVAASYIARLLQRYRWIAYVGLAIILYVSIKMIYEGWVEVAPFVNGAGG